MDWSTTAQILVIMVPLVGSIFGALVVFRGGREERNNAVVNSSIALLNEVQEERESWKKRVEHLEDQISTFRTDLSGTQGELREARKEHVQCQMSLSEMKAKYDQLYERYILLKERAD